ncbi:MAG: bifunctional metallophosphatase/5'-nucleotidase, partial [Kiritimatiellae bacterium]|nr:bifunctional metallophosphatase/5'-nucleotidase [Kiritimatiellia bacterium]
AYAGPYPTVITSPTGETVCVVQAGSYALAVGKLDVQFDPAGRIQSWSGGNNLLVLTDNASASSNTLREDSAMRALIDEKYRPELLKTYGPVIAQVPAPLNHERTPTDPEGHGSKVAPLAAEAFCRAMEDLGIPVDAGLVNAGGVRTSIAAGNYFKNQTLLEVMIFGNSLCDFQLTGADIKHVFETVIDSALANPDGDGRFPYTARLAYVYDPEQPAGSRITSLRFLDMDGTWNEADDSRLYHLVSNSYVTDGNDGYETLKTAIDTRNQVTRHADLIDNQAFTTYVQRQSEEGHSLVPLPYSPVTLKASLTPSHENQTGPY